jgi:ketosteroid isomerase-like protein
MPTNLEIVQALYTAFANGDIAGATAVMADDIVWHEAESNKLADRNPYVGPQAVVEGVFARLAEDFDDFAVETGEFVASGDTVAMQGRYRGTAKATSETINPQIVHWWKVKDGKLAAFQQHVDTLALARALGEV